MIQRRQTIYLLLAFAALLICALSDCTFAFLCGWTAGLAVFTFADIFLYKRRKLQAMLCMVLTGLVVVYYVALAVFNHQMGGSLHLTWPMALPALAIIFLVFARKGIMHDEKLVRSLDRIR